MDDVEDRDEAIELLQQLGLKEYEARCYVGLARVTDATARDISEITDVPRTRVYDAIRVLEARGLVEIHHGSPQRFRAVPVGEAVDTLRDQFDDRMGTLVDALEGMDPVDLDEDSAVHEVWSLSGSEAVANRTQQLIEEADEEIVLIVGEEALLTDELLESLAGLPETVDVILGAVDEAIRRALEEAVPDARVFVSGLDWLRADARTNGETAIGRLLLVDRSAILVSSYEPKTGVERAVFGRGFGNGLVVVARRLMATGMLEKVPAAAEE